MKSLPKCYVIRIYRCGSNDSRGLVGIVEEPDSSAVRAFKNINELWEIVAPHTARRSGNATKDGVSGKEAVIEKAPAGRLNQKDVPGRGVSQSRGRGGTH